MLKIFYLSHVLNPADPRPPAIPAPEVTPFLTIAKDGAAVQMLRVANHTGTHVDSPAHVIPGGIPITAFAPAEFVFSQPVVIRLRAADDAIIQPADLQLFTRELQCGDLVLFKFGTARIRRGDPQRFSLHSPGFGVESARWLRRTCPKLRAIGMDVPSLACIAYLDRTMAAHNELLKGKGRRFLVIEDMDLHQPLARLCEVRICPWLVTGMDSSPCTVIGECRSPAKNR